MTVPFRIIHISETAIWRPRRHYARPFGLVTPCVSMFKGWWGTGPCDIMLGRRGLYLNRIIAEWCRDILGYVPPIKQLPLHGEDSPAICAMFANTTDIDLFYLAFAEKWQYRKAPPIKVMPQSNSNFPNNIHSFDVCAY